MILSVCENPDVLKTIKIIKTIILIIRIVAPLSLILTTMISYVKGTLDADTKEPTKIFIKRVIAALIIAIVPSIISTTVRLADVKQEYYPCLQNATTEGVRKAYYEQAKEYILNAKNTLRMGNYLVAKAAVNKLKGEDKRELMEELEKVKKEIEEAEKERQRLAEEAARRREEDRRRRQEEEQQEEEDPGPVTPVDPTSPVESCPIPEYTPGPHVEGKYSKVQIIDMPESTVKAMSKSECIDFIGSAAQLVYKEYGGVLPSITIGQACLESGYCKHFENTSFNPYGLMGYPGNKPKVNKLRKFDNFYEATYYHYKYFESYPKVYTNFLIACKKKEVMNACRYLHAYAGRSTTYCPSVQSIIRTYDLGRYDY